MQVINTSIEGVKIIEPDYHRDGRGYFVETYNVERYKAAGIAVDFVKDNESFSTKGWCEDFTGRRRRMPRRNSCA